MAAVSRPESEIRALRMQDLDAVAELEASCYEFPWSRGIFADCLRAGHPCWVLWVQGQIAGYGILSIAAGEAHILNICIGQAWRGQGLGRRLLLRLLDVIRWSGAERVFLEVRPSNPVAQKLYASVGFTEIGRRPRYYPAREGREDAIVMELALCEPDQP
ncbi:ribosomal protein S18-alanine N-acetyltransferase [Dyella sp.]|jgi:ribosomal-protein-alanine N-acetyltransferase|uniref:ribosomal protein S18-alanine N-acetyltransferase n=1 Tax=Dyella sp. TaxID=1869338 RepID=UPI002D764D10|nr:ribosomal protein S18-alanine N-acetyltransferase [Dyella sp.]HET6430931.1 ribosomal protein S18-alanine N-acetyltransferase [Dyella sp.]